MEDEDVVARSGVYLSERDHKSGDDIWNDWPFRNIIGVLELEFAFRHLPGEPLLAIGNAQTSNGVDNENSPCETQHFLGDGATCSQFMTNTQSVGLRLYAMNAGSFV